MDNGRPFGDPQLQTIPVLALWLIAHGITVIWNPPARPQANAKVERAQATLNRWTEPHTCKNTEQLQDRIDKQVAFYNNQFRVRRLGQKSKLEVFPDLYTIKRQWNPADFEIQRVIDFLAKGNWERKVNGNGQLSIYGQRFSVGTKFKHQIVSVKVNSKNNHWQVFDQNLNLIKEVPTVFTKDNICNLDLS